LRFGGPWLDLALERQFVEQAVELDMTGVVSLLIFSPGSRSENGDASLFIS